MNSDELRLCETTREENKCIKEMKSSKRVDYASNDRLFHSTTVHPLPFRNVLLWFISWVKTKYIGILAWSSPLGLGKLRWDSIGLSASLGTSYRRGLPPFFTFIFDILPVCFWDSSNTLPIVPRMTKGSLSGLYTPKLKRVCKINISEVAQKLSLINS